MTSMRRTTAALVAAAIVAAAGCGGDDGGGSAGDFEGEQQQVAEVVDRLGSAARDGDVKTICEELITVELQRSVREAAGTSCAQEFTENIVSDETRFDVQEVEVDGTRATATVVDQADRRSEIAFQRVGDEWRIARIT